MPRKIAVLGATGSIGQNTLQVIRDNPGAFEVTCLTARGNVALLLEQARTFRPQRVVISDEKAGVSAVRSFEKLGVEVLTGEEALSACLENDPSDLVVNALVGAVGLLPTLAAIRAGKQVALANKETLVMAGDRVNREAREHGVTLLPIDSEHSAVFQCLVGEQADAVEKIILTGSGGPFLRREKRSLSRVTVQEALAHPNWSMGQKITIDSATLMNKGLEVIEAFYLFGVPLEKIQVVIHPESIIHSMVVFVDGSVKAQLGVPDMRLPIQYALFYPNRRPSSYERLNFARLQSLTFFEPDMERFPCLELALQVLKQGGTAPAVLNGANEMAVRYFLEEKISFTQIPELIEAALQAQKWKADPDIEDILEADRWSREFVRIQVEGKGFAAKKSGNDAKNGLNF